MNIAREEDQILASILKCAGILVKYIMLNIEDTIKNTCKENDEYSEMFYRKENE